MISDSGVVHPKWVLIATFQTFFIAFLFSYYQVDIPHNFLKLAKPALGVVLHRIEKYTGGASDSSDDNEDDSPKLISKIILTPSELQEYNGEKGSKGLYLAVLGKIYDVSKGKQHYGPGGGYHFFAGRDATRAFVSGEFTDKGLVDDVTDMTAQDMLGIEEWMGFYEKQYKFIGYLQGTYYNSKGKSTKSLKYVLTQIAQAHKWQSSQQEETARYPPCNSEWNQGKGGRVWCSDRSGGINRDWVGVPRKMFKPGSNQSRCACIKNSGPAQDGSGGNRGDLDNPNIREYAGCNQKAVSCKISDS